MVAHKGALPMRIETREARRAAGFAAQLLCAALVCAPAVAQTTRGALIGAIEGVGRAMQDIGDEMQREADERERVERRRRLQQADDELRQAQIRRLQQAEQIRQAELAKAEVARKRAQALIAQLSPVSGTAFAIAPELVVTNYHVVSGFGVIKVTGADGREYPAEPTIIDAGNDLAVLTVVGLRAKPLLLSSDADIRKGTRVYALGYPRPEVQGLELKITEGIVNSLTGFRGETGRLQMSAEVQPGNSGGPILGSSGAVLGIVVSGLRQGQNVNYAIKPSAVVKALAACDCGAEKGLKKPPARPVTLPPEEIASSAERSVFRVSAQPVAVSARRLERGDFGAFSEDELRQSGEAIKWYYPDFPRAVRSDDFKAWLSKQPSQVIEDYEQAEFPEIAIRVLDRFYSSSKAHFLVR